MSEPPIESEDAMELPYGTVTGSFIIIDLDSSDEDHYPDIQPLNGAVFLRATTRAGHVEGKLAELRSIQLSIFGGQIVDHDQQPGARILSTDVDLGVDDWAWTASFSFETGLSVKPVTFKLPAGSTLSLTDGLIPVTSNPVQIVEGKPGESAYEIMVRRGDFVGTEEEWIDFYFNREGGGGGEVGEVTWADILGKPTTFPPSTHNHTFEQVPGLQAALDEKQPTGNYATQQYVQDQVNAIPNPDLSGLVESSTITNIWTGTAAQYAAISPKVSTTLYLIT